MAAPTEAMGDRDVLHRERPGDRATEDPAAGPGELSSAEAWRRELARRRGEDYHPTGRRRPVDVDDGPGDVKHEFDPF